MEEMKIQKLCRKGAWLLSSSFREAQSSELPGAIGNHFEIEKKNAV